MHSTPLSRPNQLLKPPANLSTIQRVVSTPSDSEIEGESDHEIEQQSDECSIDGGAEHPKETSEVVDGEDREVSQSRT